ncbi:MAG TPA: hypothetical protein DCP51_09125 [Clostridiales bacterium]|nr:hypothetical protein [Clostridiales bacterium]
MLKLSCRPQNTTIKADATGEEASVPYKRYGAPPLYILSAGRGSLEGDITECRCPFFIEIKGIRTQKKGGDVFNERVRKKKYKIKNKRG